MDIVFCHCKDCKRVGGAPVAAFASFDVATIDIDTPSAQPVSHHPGVHRWFCAACGSPLAATYDYLPGMIYVPVGVIDQAARFRPTLHSHADAQYPWLHVDDGLPRQSGSSRDVLVSRESCA
ncbi:MAG: GFA family protein [Pseudomonadota bacterium]